MLSVCQNLCNVVFRNIEQNGCSADVDGYSYIF